MKPLVQAVNADPSLDAALRDILAQYPPDDRPTAADLAKLVDALDVPDAPTEALDARTALIQMLETRGTDPGLYGSPAFAAALAEAQGMAPGDAALLAQLATLQGRVPGQEANDPGLHILVTAVFGPVDDDALACLCRLAGTNRAAMEIEDTLSPYVDALLERGETFESTTEIVFKLVAEWQSLVTVNA